MGPPPSPSPPPAPPPPPPPPPPPRLRPRPPPFSPPAEGLAGDASRSSCREAIERRSRKLKDADRNCKKPPDSADPGSRLLDAAGDVDVDGGAADAEHAEVDVVAADARAQDHGARRRAVD